MHKTLLSRWLPAMAVILFTGIVIYANSLQAPFVFDDIDSIVLNEVIKNPANFFTNSRGYDFLPNRYIVYLSFALNYYFGGIEVEGYHLVNLFIHLASSLLAYALLRQTFNTPYFTSLNVTGGAVTTPASNSSLFDVKWFLPLFAALLFVAHPVQTQAVTYTVQRVTLLASFFYLLSLYCYLQARLHLESRGGRNSPVGKVGVQAEKPTMAGAGWPLLLMTGAVIAAILAMKSKEIAFTLPLAALLYEVCFFSGSWKRRLIYLLPIFLTMLIVPLTILATGTSSKEVLVAAGESLRVDSSLSRIDYLLTQLRVIVSYLRLLILPVNQNLDYDYTVYDSFLAPPVYLSLLLLLALLSLAVFLFWRTSQRRMKQGEHAPGAAAEVCNAPLPAKPQSQPGVADSRRFLRFIPFGIFWFFLSLSVESSIIPIADVIMEHRLYLPGFGAAAVCAAVFCLTAGMAEGRAGGRLLPLVALLLVLALGFATWQRNQIWNDPISLWQDVVAKSPEKARPYSNLGLALTDAGRLAEAIVALRRAIELDQNNPAAYNNLGRAYILNGQSKAAVPKLKMAIMLDRDYLPPYISLAAAFNQMGQYLNTVALLEQAPGWIGSNAPVHYHLAIAYAKLGNRERFNAELAILRRLDPALAAKLPSR